MLETGSKPPSRAKRYRRRNTDNSFAVGDGDITGIEISDGEFRLVRWPDDEGDPRGKVLESGSLKDVFRSLEK